MSTQKGPRQHSPGRLRFGRDRFVVGPWQGDPGVAYLNPTRTSDLVESANLARCMESLRVDGYRAVVTPALHPEETAVYFAAGFEEFDSLVVLAHRLLEIPILAHGMDGQLRMRRARRGDLETVFDLDGRAFPPNWRMDALGVHEARSATKRVRFRVVESTDPSTTRKPVGYAITGRTGSLGFLQRLATDPDWGGRGIGSALVIDALEWVASRGCNRLLVNTQHTNRRALALYESLGFVTTATRLTVLRCSL